MSLLSDLVHLRTIEHGSPVGAFSPGAPLGRILQEESACERAIPTSAPLVVRSPL
ncbi:BQ5605_C008g04991 [Microbotryum silenes-dioicae]|uniref:BQ5605_C008g04991 protein n=1 Tax=Microbotryum silenes-dioicae TaxID=796604 RepID=A0A2X0MGF2_9BASI|nr:BQ5605_C008g04991 [Microbotryum silenes-dioicae]